MTSEQAFKSLTPAQRRVFNRLLRTRNADGLYLSRTERRSAAVLVRAGWAEVTNADCVGVHYRLTDLGKLIAGPIVFTPGAP